MEKSHLIIFISSFLFLSELFAQSGSLDLSFDPGSGFGGSSVSIQAIAVQNDGKVLAGGQFTSYNGVTRNRIARINEDGSLDLSFDPGTGASGALSPVIDIVVQPDGKILIAGTFTSYNGVAIKCIARLNSDGTLDSGFNIGTGAVAGDPPVTYVGNINLQSDGKIIISGNFTTFNGVARNHVARLNPDGSLDNTYNPGSLLNGKVGKTGIQSDGKLIISGNFTDYNGTSRNKIARLNIDGSLDTSFDPGTGIPSPISDLIIKNDGKIIISGSFTTYNGAARNRIAQINQDGSLDTGFDPGTGANNAINEIELQPEGRIIAGGSFTDFNGVTRNYITSINTDGSLDNSFDPLNSTSTVISSLAVQNFGKIIIGGGFTSYNGTSRNGIARIFGCLTPQPISILGNSTVCNQSSQVYSISPVPGAADYTWSLPTDWSGSSSTISISSAVGETDGIISVIANGTSCANSLPQILTATISPPAPVVSMCLISVDTLSTHNVIYWEKPITALIDSFFIYREITTNNYQKVGAVAYEDYNEYHDYSADPNTTTYKYKVSVLDTCGFESAKSGFHNTIHLQNNGNGNLAWTQYGIENSGNPVTFYRVYRDDFGTNNFQPINTSIPGGNTTYTDVNYAAYPNARYVVDVNWDISCTPFRSSVTTTRSNRWQNNITVGIEDEFENMVLIYPNPASDIITIEFPETLNISGFEITNMLGQTIYSEVFSLKGNTKKQIDVSGFAEGIYLLEMQTVNGNMNKKIIIQ